MKDTRSRSEERVPDAAVWVGVLLCVVWVVALKMDWVPPLLLGAIIIFVPFWLIGFLVIRAVILVLHDIFGGPRR